VLNSCKKWDHFLLPFALIRVIRVLLPSISGFT